MQDQVILTVCNLKPVAMRGVKSHAMVLCASDAEKTKVRLASGVYCIAKLKLNLGLAMGFCCCQMVTY